MATSARAAQRRFRGSPPRAAHASSTGPSRVSTSCDRGFTLVELIVSMFIVVLLFLAFGRALAGALQTSRDNRLAQEATGIATEYIELARGLAWTELAMSSIDPAAPLLGDGGGAIDGHELGIDADESLVYTVDGVLSPKVVETVDGTPFTVWSYVAEAGELRRVVVEVEWELEDESERSFRTSTLVSELTAG